MDMLHTLRSSLLDLLSDTQDNDLKLIIGGGYGIYLKREHVREQSRRTLFRELPEARSTNDLDLFLRPALLIQPEQLRPLASALTGRGYRVVESAAKFQFAKPGPQGGIAGGVKIDLLTGPQRCFNGSDARVDDRRVRPRPSVGLHAHHVDEAVTLEEDLLALPFAGTTSDGKAISSQVYLPHPLTFAMMKLFAFRDRASDVSKDNGSYHALDLYAVLGSTNEQEWDRANELRRRFEGPEIREAAKIVGEFFGSRSALGMLRLQDSPYFRKELQLDDFRKSLSELFPDQP